MDLLTTGCLKALKQPAGYQSIWLKLIIYKYMFIDNSLIDNSFINNCSVFKHNTH